MNAQFKDMSKPSMVVRKFDAVAKAVGVAPHTSALGDESRLLVDYVRSLLLDGCVFSLPTEVCKIAVSTVGATSSLATAPPPINGLVQEMVHDLKVLLGPDIVGPVPDHFRTFRVTKRDPHARA